MSSDRIKVAGYTQKTSYNGQIEYRNFSPDLVGVQLASDGGTPLFTMGNFAVTTNFDPKKNKRFVINNLSNFITLTDLDLTLNSALNLLKDNDGVFLNLDKTNLSYYSLFGSLREFTRVSLENIISTWPAALYVTPIYSLPPIFITQSGTTFDEYTYDQLNNESTFKVSTNVITNRFGINILSNNTGAQINTLRNLNLSYQSYVVMVNGLEYNILGFTGTTDLVNNYIYFKTKGDVFSGQTSGYLTYYIKPNSINENLFYNKLTNFEYYLLNRHSNPKFTSTFSFSEKSDNGAVLYLKESVTWPTTDGYNIDFDTEEYDTFATRLLEITTNHDLITSNLMVRFLVAESITDFDTTAVHLDPINQDTSDQKVNKTLTIYGAQYDEINKFIMGIQYANVVSYDKVNNTPDIYLKDLARILGWGLISSVLENNLLTSYIQPSQSTYQGHDVGLTAVEADIELWRRLILNTPWIWKSKGTRKSIEFLFRFIGTPLGLIKFNEYIYLAENKIDLDLFQSVLTLNNLSTDISLYPLDSDGFPLPKPNTPEMYFQNDGLWYRQTGGDESTIDITTGNNPHVGPYDGGYRYINQFRELIPNFSAVTITSSTTTLVTTNIFTNYNFGSFTSYSGGTFVDLTTEDGYDFSGCYVVSATTIEDPKKRQDQTDCGCDIPENLRSLSVCIEKAPPKPFNCQDEIAGSSLTTPYGYYNYDFNQYLPDGSQYTVNGVPVYYTSQFVNVECCNKSGLVPYYYDDYIGIGTNESPFVLQNSGYICCNSKMNKCGCYVTCKWKLATPRWATVNGADYLQFQKEDGTKVFTSKDGCNCISEFTVPVFLSASSTDVGYACQLTSTGKNDIDTTNSVIYQTYEKRSIGEISCTSIYNPPVVPKIFAVIVNNGSQVNGKLNNIVVNNTRRQIIVNNYQNVNTPLVSRSTTPMAGYYSPFTPTQGLVPQSRDTLTINIAKTLTQNATIEFNPSAGHKMYYLISNQEFDPTSFINVAYSQLNEIRAIYNQSLDRYTGTFAYNRVGQPSNIYVVIDISQERTLNTFCYKFQNTGFLPGTITYTDTNGIVKNETVNPLEVVNRCAVRGSQSSVNVLITGGNVPCTMDNQCNTPTFWSSPIAVGNEINNACFDLVGNNFNLIYTTTPVSPFTPLRLVDGQTYYDSNGNPSQIGLTWQWVSDGCNYGKIDQNGVFTLYGTCPNSNC